MNTKDHFLLLYLINLNEQNTIELKYIITEQGFKSKIKLMNLIQWINDCNQMLEIFFAEYFIILYGMTFWKRQAIYSDIIDQKQKSIL